MVDHGDGGISRDVSRSTRVSPCVLLGIFTFSSHSNSWLTRGGIGAGALDIVVGSGSGIAVSAGAGGAAKSAEDGLTTGIDCGIET